MGEKKVVGDALCYKVLETVSEILKTMEDAIRHALASEARAE